MSGGAIRRRVTVRSAKSGAEDRRFWILQRPDKPVAYKNLAEIDGHRLSTRVALFCRFEYCRRF